MYGAHGFIASNESVLTRVNQDSVAVWKSLAGLESICRARTKNRGPEIFGNA